MAKVLPFEVPKLPGKPVNPVQAEKWFARLRKRQTEQWEATRKARLEDAQRAEDIRNKILD